MSKNFSNFKITKEISLIIFALIFAVAYITAENQKLDYKEKFRQEKIKESEINEQLREDCINKAFDDYHLNWRENCKSNKLKDNCSLPTETAISLEKWLKSNKDVYFKKYPEINQ